MKTIQLRLVSFGAAKILTRDGLGEEFIEDGVYTGRYPTAG